MSLKAIRFFANYIFLLWWNYEVKSGEAGRVFFLPRPSRNSLIHQNEENPFGWFFDRKIVIPSDISRGEYRSQGIWVNACAPEHGQKRDSKMWRVFRSYFDRKLRPALFSSLAPLPFSSFLFFSISCSCFNFNNLFFFPFHETANRTKVQRSNAGIDVPANFKFVPTTRGGNHVLMRATSCFWRVRLFDFRVHFPTVFPWGGTWSTYPICLHLSGKVSDCTAFSIFLRTIVCLFFFFFLMLNPTLRRNRCCDLCIRDIPRFWRKREVS